MKIRGLNFNQASNRLLCCLSPYARFETYGDDTVLVERYAKVVKLYTGCSFHCTCGCKEKFRWELLEEL